MSWPPLQLPPQGDCHPCSVESGSLGNRSFPGWYTGPTTEARAAHGCLILKAGGNSAHSHEMLRENQRNPTALGSGLLWNFPGSRAGRSGSEAHSSRRCFQGPGHVLAERARFWPSSSPRLLPSLHIAFVSV